MIPDDKQPDPVMEKIIAGIRDEQIEPTLVQSAAERVWARLCAHAPIRNCADFRSLMPDYRAGKLSEARALLLQDHTRECVACRKALSGETPAAVPIRRRRFEVRPFRWAIAAALAATIGLSAWSLLNRLGPATANSRLVAQSVEGMLFRVSDQGNRPVAFGDELPGGAQIRTAKDSSAILRLSDGSLVEMRERSGLSVSATRKDLTLHLERGSVIVQAAKRRSGRLYVAARDCRVSVTGTVFSVNSGIKGSRVSVIEGEVRVAQGSQHKVLHPGDQFSTNPSMTPVPVRDEIAWSRNFERHLALLREFSTLRKSLEQVRLPEVRYSSRLLGLLPEDTAVYASIPNLGRALAEARRVFHQRVQDSPALRQWWEQKMEESKHGPNLDEVLNKLSNLSDYLGDEVVIAAALDSAGKLQDPIFLAEVRRPGLREFLKAEAPELDTGDRLLLRSGLMALSPNAALLARIGESANRRESRGFAASPFGVRISEAYRDGVGLLFSADLERIAASHQKSKPPVAGMKYLIAEQKEIAGQTDTRAVLTFDGPRKGVASWLAPPSPMGALEFISPDAAFVSAFAIKNPAAILEELLAEHPNLRQAMPEIESKLGAGFLNDLSASLGGEFAFAIDGPALPIPSWKLAVEVYDPLRLQSAIRRLADAANRETAAHGKPGVQLTEEAAGGRTYYRLASPAAKKFTEAHYTFADGYLLAAPSRELLDRAIQYRATAYTLARSAGFKTLLPQDRHSDFSGLVYHNLGPAIAPFVEGLSAGDLLTPEQRKSIESVSSEMKPMLLVFYGEEDQITVATTGSLLGFGVSNLMGLPGPMSLMHRPPRH